MFAKEEEKQQGNVHGGVERNKHKPTGEADVLLALLGCTLFPEFLRE